MTSRPRSPLLVVHALVLGAAVVYGAVAWLVAGPPDVNLGANLALVTVSLLGSPWTWPLIFVRLADPGQAVIALLGAGVNLAIHAGVLKRED